MVGLDKLPHLISAKIGGINSNKINNWPFIDYIQNKAGAATHFEKEFLLGNVINSNSFCSFCSPAGAPGGGPEISQWPPEPRPGRSFGAPSGGLETRRSAKVFDPLRGSRDVAGVGPPLPR